MNNKELTFKKIKDNYDTGKVGEINKTYDDIVYVFGQPHIINTPNPKLPKEYIDVKWSFAFSDGEIFTIYNYKNGKVWNEKKGKDYKKINKWCLGGESVDVVKKVNELMRELSKIKQNFDELVDSNTYRKSLNKTIRALYQAEEYYKSTDTKELKKWNINIVNEIRQELISLLRVNSMKEFLELEPNVYVTSCFINGVEHPPSWQPIGTMDKSQLKEWKKKDCLKL